jgi:polyisoprenoid-binding protein YceI
MMKLPSGLISVAAFVTIVSLVSCTTSTVAPVVERTGSSQPGSGHQFEARYAALPTATGKLYNLDPKVSSVRIYVFRAGQAAKVGHNHVLSAPEFKGYFFLSPAGVGASSFDLEFRLDQLEIDNPDHRSSLGKAFASKLSPEAIASTREHMLGDDNLQAMRFPFVRIRSVQISGEAPKFAAKIAVELHGQTREIWVPLSVTGLPENLTVDGSLVLRQTDFGVKPYSVLGGLLAVEDEVIVEFKLSGFTSPRAAPS